MNKIAVIGLGCRFPGGVYNPDDFWNMISGGIDATKDVPADRWDIRSFYHPEKSVPGKTYTYHGGFMDDIDQFDADFFGISPREASYLDPQQRLLLEVSWEAMENAGIDPARLSDRKVGVYIGGFTLDYKVLQFSTGNKTNIDVHTATGSMMTMLSNRISYTYDFKGPSLSVDTACSSSLVALHLACQALSNNECTIALAGGVNIIAIPEYTIAESKAGFLSPDGRSKSFDSRADGYARGEGAGIVILKSLENAVSDNDLIYGVIVSTGVNQDGRTKGGITIPNGTSQEALIRETYKKAGISPGDISYIEAHGTGTFVGDPIEINSIANVLATDREHSNKCFVGSVKTNIGHLEAAAGIAAFIKSCLILQNEKIPPNIHFQNPNPRIPFEKICLKVPVKKEDLTKKNGIAYIGVNSFGFGGTNAHLVLAGNNCNNNSNGQKHAIIDSKREFPYLLPITARSEYSLNEMVKRYLDFLQNHNDCSMEDLCYSTSLKRAHHDLRLAISFRTKQDLCQKLNNYLADEDRPGIVKSIVNTQLSDKIVFVYTGMGPIWWGMGRQLLQTNRVFKEVIDECDHVTLSYAGWSLLDELSAPESKSKLGQTMYAQPANFALQAGLTKVWKSLGIVPDAVIGHSTGEIGSFYASGIFSLEDALKLSIERGKWQQESANKNGAMLAVGLFEQEALEAISEVKDDVSIAAINSPKSVTLSGTDKVLDKIRIELESKEIFARFLRVNIAYHSCHMDPILEGFSKTLVFLKPKKPSISIYSTVTGKLINEIDSIVDYWRRNVRHEVRFGDAIQEALDAGYRTFLEIGPHPVLKTSIRECLSSKDIDGKTLSSIRRKEDELIAMISTFSELYTSGYPVDLQKINPVARFIRLPLYAWNHEKYWIETEESREIRLGLNQHAVLGRKLQTSGQTWEVEVDYYKYPYIKDHMIKNTIVFPGAGYVELALACAQQIYGDFEYVINNIQFNRAMFLKDNDVKIIQTNFDPKNSTVEIFSRSLGEDVAWTSHSSSTINLRISGHRLGNINIEKIKERCNSVLEQDQCYKLFSLRGFQYGDCFRGVKRLWKGDDEVLTNMEIPKELGEIGSDYIIHPALLDSCFQGILALISENSENNKSEDIFLPVGIQSLTVYEKNRPVRWTHAVVVERNTDNIIFNIKLLDEQGNVLIDICGLKAQNLSSNKDADYRSLCKGLFTLQWCEKQLSIDENNTALDPDHEYWMIFKDQSGFSDQLIEMAENSAIQYCTVGYGNHVNSKGSNYVVDPVAEKSFDDIFQSLARDIKITKIIYLWPLDSALAEKTDLENIHLHTNIGCLGLLSLLKSLERNQITPKIWIITRGTQVVNNSGSENGLLQSSIWGISRVFGHNEKTELWGGIIDIDPQIQPEECESFFREIKFPDGEDQIAYRGNKRYVLRIKKFTAPKMYNPIKIASNGSYIITGAFGALGKIVCKWMVDSGAKRLILLGRTEFPERILWNKQDKDSKLGKRIQFIKELENMGASICTANIDVSDKELLEGFLNKYRDEGWPPIRGVIHTAGIVRDNTIDNMDIDTFRMVLAPKISGAWNLHIALQEDPLDFFILFSSIASQVISSKGQSNYASANAFIDSLANFRRIQRLPAISINWGPWSEVGMAAEHNLIEYFRDRGISPITPRDGTIILSTLFSSKSSQVIVAPELEWIVVEKSYPAEKAPLLIKDMVEDEIQMKAAISSDEGTAEIDPLEELHDVPENQRAEIINHHLKLMIAKVLEINALQLDENQPVDIYGIDSMMSTEIQLKIKLNFNVSIPLVDFLQGKTISDLGIGLLNRIRFD